MIHSIIDRLLFIFFQMETTLFCRVGQVFVEGFVSVIVFVKLIFPNLFIRENTLQ